MFRRLYRNLHYRLFHRDPPKARLADTIDNIHRSDGMQIIHLFGDSIFRGYALGGFSDQIDPQHCLYALRSISATVNPILRDNDVPIRFSFSGLAVGSSSAPARIASLIAEKRIVAGDWIIFEDAGEHSQNPDAYQTECETLITAAMQSDAKVAFLTMYDVADLSPTLRPFEYQPTPLNCCFNTPFVGRPSGVMRTINDAIRAAVTAYPDAILIDINQELRAWRRYTYGQSSVPIEAYDGVHFNAWGQTRIAGILLKVTGAREYIRSIKHAQAVAANNWRRLRYDGNPQFWRNSDTAVDFMTSALLC